MAELNVLGYLPGTSTYHRMDVRFKLMGFICISLTCLSASARGMGIATITVALIFCTAQLPLRLILRELRYLGVLLILILCSRCLFTPGEPFLAVGKLVFSREGLHSGLLISWRLAAIILLSVLMVATTKTTEMKAGLQWYLAFIPWINEKKAAMMLSLVMRFMPLLLKQARETSEAQKARGIENRRNPVYRLKVLVIPVLRRTFESADRLVLAMEARCYSENRTDHPLTATPGDGIRLAIAVLICLICLWAG